MESRVKKEYIREMKQPTREQLIAEVAVLTELVRVLSDRVTELEGASNTLNEMRRRYDDHFAKALGRK
jgi:predicted nuclease with TOPRIM domain